jgi:hypothetical protein
MEGPEELGLYVYADKCLGYFYYCILHYYYYYYYWCSNRNISVSSSSSIVVVKGKGNPVTGPGGPIGRVEV